MTGKVYRFHFFLTTFIGGLWGFFMLHEIVLVGSHYKPPTEETETSRIKPVVRLFPSFIASHSPSYACRYATVLHPLFWPTFPARQSSRLNLSQTTASMYWSSFFHHRLLSVITSRFSFRLLPLSAFHLSYFLPIHVRLQSVTW
ncbi:hypothetical protein CW304_21430 [Bacillus sp. UFRGS-B20]|nr:hypothetical protein CW304_21430 [Bacillus sp. UFRGS-B20]